MIIRGNCIGHPNPDPRKGMSMEGGINMFGNKLNGVADPVNNDDAVNLKYFNDNVSVKINEALGVIENGYY